MLDGELFLGNMNNHYELKFPLGSKVSIKLEGELEGVKVFAEKEVFVSKAILESDCHHVYILYGLTIDLCGPYHYGEDVRWWKKENEIKKAE